MSPLRRQGSIILALNVKSRDSFSFRHCEATKPLWQSLFRLGGGLATLLPTRRGAPSNKFEGVQKNVGWGFASRVKNVGWALCPC